MGLRFYKPNRSNKGCAFSVQTVAKVDKFTEGQLIKGEKSIYFKLIKQMTWNEEKKTGSFKGGETCSIKLNAMEIANIVYCIRNSLGFVKSLYHQSAAQTLGINFYKLINQETQLHQGYALSVLKRNVVDGQETKFAIGFTFAEAEWLMIYLQEQLSHIANALYSEDMKLASDYKKVNEAKFETKTETMPAGSDKSETSPITSAENAELVSDGNGSAQNEEEALF